MENEIPTLRDILSRVMPSYIRVKPFGLEIKPGLVQKRMEAKILSWGFARTLYKNRKPSCRSLDGIRALKKNRACAACEDKRTCTPQIRLDLIHPSGVFRLLLAYTSMRNFLLFMNELPRKDNGEGMPIAIDVIDRGRWGELRFAAGTAKPAG